MKGLYLAESYNAFKLYLHWAGKISETVRITFALTGIYQKSITHPGISKCGLSL